MPKIEVGKAYKTYNDSLVLIKNKNEQSFEGIVIHKLEIGYDKNIKYRHYDDSGKVVNFKADGKLLVFSFGSKYKSNGWDIVIEIDRKEIDSILKLNNVKTEEQK